MKKLNIWVLLALFISLTACHSDSEEILEGETTTTTPTVGVAVDGSVLGYVYDEDDQPIAGASVKLLSKSTTTDEHGVFRFKNIELDQNGTYISATKNGYMLGSDMVYARKDVLHTSRIMMFSLNETDRFTSNSGGVISIEGGGKITFPANSISSEKGGTSLYNGQVIVTAKRIATDDTRMDDMMPGALVAQDSEGRTVALGSMGMVAVELRDQSGNELHIKKDAKATVVFPIADNQKGGAPESIALWSFDESQGIWIEEGAAKREGDNYIGEVSHFSFWNCDAPFPLINLCGKVKFADGLAASGYKVKITTDPYGVGYGWTNEDGSFCGKVPKGKKLIIEVSNPPCRSDEYLTRVEVGGFETNVELDDILIPSNDTYVFEGEVVCDAQGGINEATIIYEYNNTRLIAESTDQGGFRITINNQCQDIEKFKIFAVDPATGKASTTKTIDLTSAEDIRLNVCSGCEFDVEIGLDPSVDPCVERRLIANVSGDGNYTYSWSNGATSQINADSIGGLICVTVKDTDQGCEQSVCKEFTYVTEIYANMEGIGTCGEETGEIYLNVVGGYPPYTYAWSDPSITVVNDSIAENVPPGDYTLTITDSEGCSKELSTVIADSAKPVVTFTKDEKCNYTKVEAIVEGAVEPVSYYWDGISRSSSSITVYESKTYCVTIIDGNGCVTEECIDITIVDPNTLVDISVESCTQGKYTFKNNSDTYDVVFYTRVQESIELAPNASKEVNILELGFEDVYGVAWSSEEQCEFRLNLTYPRLVADSLNTTYNVTNPTCASCTDGKIELTDAYQDYDKLEGAAPGSIIVLNADNADVTSDATGGNIGKGTYYVVVTDANTGCYIYGKKVKLE